MNTVQQNRTILDVLRSHSKRQGEKIAFRVLGSTPDEEEAVTYHALLEQARALGNSLRSVAQPGDRALIVEPTSIGYIRALLACLSTGVVAVPLPEAGRVRRGLSRAAMVALDCCPAALLCATRPKEEVLQGFHTRDGRSLAWVSTASAGETAEDLFGSSQPVQPFAPAPDDLAFLQYTSGSTSQPKGVMVTHGNIMANEAMIGEAFATTGDSVIVGWLPLFHDMGLIGNVLHSLYRGATCVLMSPSVFLHNPVRWLTAISKYSATVSGGPNFAYDLCVDRIDEKACAGIDLSSWQVAFNGSEPVRDTTIERFFRRFRHLGFRKAAAHPCYGLAECTLLVASKVAGSEMVTRQADALRLGIGDRVGALHPPKTPESGSDKTLVSSGRVAAGLAVRIVNPHTEVLCPEGMVGEVRVSGPSVAAGYWPHAEATNAVDGESGEWKDKQDPDGHRKQTCWLPTGDLGFLDGGELYLTGRLKDLIILNGLNIYPQDVEDAILSLASLGVSGCAASGFDQGRGEELLVLVEVSGGGSDQPAALVTAVHEAVLAFCGVSPAEMVFLRRHSLPKTSSGKLRRAAAKDQYLAGGLRPVFVWRRPTVSASTPHDGSEMASEPAAWLEAAVAASVGAVTVELQLSAASYGIDSITATRILHAFSQRWHMVLDLPEFIGGSMATALSGGQSVEAPEARTELPRRSADGYTTFSPLTAGQQALWFLYRRDPESSAYNISCRVELAGSLRPRQVEAVWNGLTERHPSLRLRIDEQDGLPRQIAEPGLAVCEVIEEDDESEAGRERELRRRSTQPFDLTLGPPVRACFFLSPHRPIELLVSAHHLAVDFWSLEILIEDLNTLWQAACARKDLAQAFQNEPRFSLFDFVVAQQQHRSTDSYLRQRAYWLGRFRHGSPVLNLPAPRDPDIAPAQQGCACAQLSAASVQQLRRVCEAQRLTPFIVMLAVYRIFLYRITGQREFVVGIPTSGREDARFRETVGYLVNPLPLRAEMTSEMTVAEAMAATKSEVAETLRHAAYPFGELVREGFADRPGTDTPLLQTMFVYEDVRAGKALATSAENHAGVVRWEILRYQASPFPLMLTVSDLGEAVQCWWQFDGQQVASTTVAHWSQSYLAVLSAALAKLDCPLAQLPLVSEESRASLLEEASRNPGWTTLATPSVPALFSSAAIRQPTRTAVVAQGKECSYGQLAEESDRFAARLTGAGVRPGDWVALCCERRISLIAAMLGIWKAGAAFVPLDPAYPAERLQLILANAYARWLVADTVTVAMIQKHGLDAGLTVVLADREPLEVAAEASSELPSASFAIDASPAYLLYTSGSTGAPKGVVIAHKALSGFIAWAQRSFSPAEMAGVLAATSVCFDLSVFEIWATLVQGGTVLLVNNLLEWAQSVEISEQRHAVTLLNTVPSVLDEVLTVRQPPSTVMTVNLAGEPLSQATVTKLRSACPYLRVNNLYGPTETTTYSTGLPVGDVEPAIGKPLGMNRVYVLDDSLGLLPEGTIGGLFIAGGTLADGYWRQPELTAERFLPDPFYGRGERMYRTGDRVYWQADGVLAYVGREDDQIKIRGHRVELGEVTAVLRSLPGVREAVVEAAGTGADKRMAAYVAVVGDGGTGLGEDQLRLLLKSKLPAYMVPQRIHKLERLPRTLNGKVDRVGLQAMVKEGHRKEERVPDRSGLAVEAGLQDMWSELLAVKHVTLDDNFFALGGHSLLALRMTSLIEQRFRQHLSVEQVFQNPTIRELARSFEHQDEAPQVLTITRVARG